MKLPLLFYTLITYGTIVFAEEKKVSIGVSEHERHQCGHLLFKTADTALFKAKGAGRNCVRSNENITDVTY